jgi:hypothetical protein
VSRPTEPVVVSTTTPIITGTIASPEVAAVVERGGPEHVAAGRHLRPPRHTPGRFD